MVRDLSGNPTYRALWLWRFLKSEVLKFEERSGTVNALVLARLFGGKCMQRLICAVFLVMFLALTSSAIGQQNGTAMLSLRQPECPVVLVETTHGITDLLESAKLKNVSGLLLIGYRIGWVAVYPTGKEKVGLGWSVDLPLGISPGATIDVPAQRVSMDYANEGAIAVVFFVTDVRTSRDIDTAASSVWKPALEKLEEQALALAKSTMRAQ